MGTATSFGFTAAEWDVLKRGPLYMLAQVAGADSHIDAAEWTALVDMVRAEAATSDDLLRTVMADAAEIVEGEATAATDHAPLEGLREVARLLDGKPGGDGLRHALLEIGATVADASGAQLTRTFADHHGEPAWAWSAGTSAVERAALEAAAHALGLAR